MVTKIPIADLKGDTGPVSPESIIDAHRTGDNIVLEQLNGDEIDLGNLRGLPGLDGSNVLPTDTAVAQAASSTNSATRSVLDKSYTSYLFLENFYQESDANDWALALLRALNESAASGKAILLRRIYPYATRIPASAAPSNVAIHGQGRWTGFKGPVNAPVTLLNWTGKTNIELKNFSYDGGVTPALTTTISNRGIRFIDCENLYLENLYVANHANWGTSFEQCRKIVVRNHTHDGGGNGLPGGRDGVHFLDCSDFLLDGAVIWAGDDCVGITSAQLGTFRGTIRNVRGKSDGASIVISNEESTFTKPTYDLTIDGVTALEPARNVVRVQGINVGTVTERIKVMNVNGESRNQFGMQFGRIKDLSVVNCSVKGPAHGVSMTSCETFSLTNVESTSTGVDYDGFNLFLCNYGVLANCRSRNAGLWGVQLNTCTFVTIQEAVILEGGAPKVDSGVLTGGGIRIANGSDNSIVGGTIAGDKTNTALSYSGSPRLRVTDYTKLRGTNTYSTRLVGANAMQAPIASARFSDNATETDGAVIATGVRYRCTVTRVTLGVYTIQVLDAAGAPLTLGGTNFILSANAGVQAANTVRTVTQKSSGTGSFTINVVDATGAPASSQYVNLVVWDQP